MLGNVLRSLLFQSASIITKRFIFYSLERGVKSVDWYVVFLAYRRPLANYSLSPGSSMPSFHGSCLYPPAVELSPSHTTRKPNRPSTVRPSSKTLCFYCLLGHPPTMISKLIGVFGMIRAETHIALLCCHPSSATCAPFCHLSQFFCDAVPSQDVTVLRILSTLLTRDRPDSSSFQATLAIFLLSRTFARLVASRLSTRTFARLVASHLRTLRQITSKFPIGTNISVKPPVL